MSPEDDWRKNFLKFEGTRDQILVKTPYGKKQFNQMDNGKALHFGEL